MEHLKNLNNWPHPLFRPKNDHACPKIQIHLVRQSLSGQKAQNSVFNVTCINPFIFINKKRRDISLTVFTDLKHMNS